MRLIDADELKIELLGRIAMPDWVREVVLHIIDNAPTVEPTFGVFKDMLCVECGKRTKGEWILVNERLPEEKLFNPSGSDFVFDLEEVLCTTIWEDVRAYKFGKPIGHDKPHFWLGSGIMDEYVIAWQYKPEPYKKEE